MVQFIFDVQVQPLQRQAFLLIFGPGGKWGKLFSQSSGYKGTTLLNDIKNTNRFLIVDIWDTEISRTKLLQEKHQDFANLMNEILGSVTSFKDVGVFQLRAEASVKQKPKQRISHL